MDLYNMTNIFPISLVILDNYFQFWKIWIANGPPGKGTGGHTDGQTNPVLRTGHALVRGQIGGKERSIMEHIYWEERKMSNKHCRSVCYGRDTHLGSNRDFGPLRTVFHGRTDGQTEGWTDKPYCRYQGGLSESLWLLTNSSWENYWRIHVWKTKVQCSVNSCFVAILHISHPIFNSNAAPFYFRFLLFLNFH